MCHELAETVKTKGPWYKKRKKKKKIAYERLRVESIQYVLKKLRKNPSDFSARMQTYLSGTICVTCGLEASYFALERQPRQSTTSWHYNLYALKDGEEIMMTSDHIIPKSKGGPNTVENRQCMCSPCNTAKGNKWPEEIIPLPETPTNVSA